MAPVAQNAVVRRSTSRSARSAAVQAARPDPLSQRLRLAGHRARTSPSHRGPPAAAGRRDPEPGPAGSQRAPVAAALSDHRHSWQRYQPTELHAPIDDDVVEAISSLAATFETASRGLIYDHRPASVLAERLATSLRPVLEEAGRGAGSAFERDAAVVLRRLEERRCVTSARSIRPTGRRSWNCCGASWRRRRRTSPSTRLLIALA